MPPWVVTFTLMLMHTCEKVPVSSLVANALWAVTWARAEGAAGLPVPPSMVNRVAEVQLEKFPPVKSSAKIAVAVPVTTARSLAALPATVPSLGVTSTVTVSPSSPLPAWDRSKVSVRVELPDVVLRVVPLTFQT